MVVIWVVFWTLFWIVIWFVIVVLVMGCHLGYYLLLLLVGVVIIYSMLPPIRWLSLRLSFAWSSVFSSVLVFSSVNFEYIELLKLDSLLLCKYSVLVYSIPGPAEAIKNLITV
jgi:hypothetical protein